MIKLGFLIYDFIILPLLNVVFRIMALFNKKVKRGLTARKKIFENLIINMADLDKSKKMVWFHSASMGEFEQAKPIIQKLKETKDVNVVITFFSPSGYENSVKYPFADIISYIPVDTKFRTRRFLNQVKPDIAVIMRYDIWPNIILQLDKMNIPTFLVDATMRGNSARKLPYLKSFHKFIYNKLSRILTISDSDLNSFLDFNIEESKLKAVGDTRFDRVYQKSIDARSKKLFRDGVFGGKKVFVMGSSWEADENIVLPAMKKILLRDEDLILIVVPHEPTVSHLEDLENTLSKDFATIRFSLMNNYKGERIILIDSIGILLTLYCYADAAYVGGSFKQGIHNVLEPAVYGIPVIYGPKIENSQEAQYLAEKEGGFVIKNKKNAYKTIRSLFLYDEKRIKAGEIAKEYVKSNVGATKQILTEIYKTLDV
ncbi:MAG: 3-deoxy-D-manno-octulosonic acid transferase [Rhodothermaceae bacterium]